MTPPLATLLLLVGFRLQAADAISAGKGSFASAAPLHEKVIALYEKNPLLGPQARNRPLPTNDWWTTLLTEAPFPGTLWDMPLTVKPDAHGLSIAMPMGWSEKGTHLDPGTPLQISGIPKTPGMADGSILLFDFEEGLWPKDWNRSGDAFGDIPMPYTQHGASNPSGSAYACSFYGADQATGTLTSPAFILNRDYIHLRVSGGNDPDRLGVELVVNDKVIHRAVGDQSNHLKDHRWDVKAWKGQRAQIRLIDHHTGGWGFIAADAILLSDRPEPPDPGVFSRCSTLDWGDWSVQFGLHAGGASRFEVTLARGMPFVWIEAKEMQPQLIIREKDVLLALDGSSITFPYPRPEFIISREQRLFTVHAPANTQWKKRGSTLIPVSTSPIPFLVIGALPELNRASAFSKFAFAIPRDTLYEWEALPEKAEILTRWTVKAEALQGNTQRVLQGWLPHHWRITRHNLKWAPLHYQTQRGEMKVSYGSQFEITYPFYGLPITLPLADEKDPLTPRFHPEVLDDHLTQWINERANRPPADRAGKDTYWGGKEILALARTATLAQQRNHPKAREAIDMLREALSDWCTYTPGEDARYFAHYPAPWNGLVGFNPSYGSETFSDAHFHHGYFTLSAAMLIRLDPAWGKDYAPLLKQIALHYANPERDSAHFPFLRTFSPWIGHSYASGSSSTNDGNNQESTSESMMGWAGLFLLGVTLEDPDLRDTGMMGMAVETEAIREYWNDYYGWKNPADSPTFPEAYRKQHSIVGVRRDRDMGYFTWFSGEAKHIYGIQWFPTWTHLQYLGLDDPRFVKEQSAAMLARQPATDNHQGFTSLGSEWGQVALGQLMWGDPAKVCKILELSIETGGPLGTWQNGGVIYAMAHSLRQFGRPSPRLRSNLATGTVYVSAEGIRHWIGWNPSPETKQVHILEDQKVIHSFQLPAGIGPHTQKIP
ncbi:glycosyl hydrolase [Kiritimatiellaeota bacterium B1221]|nr:glycosyl hydrolase [Kiritimatiellaeota bacterium B1221]